MIIQRNTRKEDISEFWLLIKIVLSMSMLILISIIVYKMVPLNRSEALYWQCITYSNFNENYRKISRILTFLDKKIGNIRENYTQIN